MTEGWGYHKEYYHIFTRLHLSQITLLSPRPWPNIKGNWVFGRVFCIPVKSIKTTGASLPRVESCSTHSLNHVSWKQSSRTQKVSPVSFGLSSHSRSLYLFVIIEYLPWARGGGRCESGEPEITALYASVTVFLAALHKILFTAHTEEKLQEQSSSEARKSADLATLREGLEGGSGTIIIILPLLLHCQYLYCSHSVQGIQPAGDNK